MFKKIVSSKILITFFVFFTLFSLYFSFFVSVSVFFHAFFVKIETIKNSRLIIGGAKKGFCPLILIIGGRVPGLPPRVYAYEEGSLIIIAITLSSNSH